MSKYNMRAKKQNSGNNSEGGHTVDWDAFNEYLLETVGSEASRIGIIAGIVDLGEHENEPSMFPYVGDAKQETLLEDKYDRGNRVETIDGVETLVLPKRPSQHFAIIVDFPEIMMDYGKFFSPDGESSVKPYRHILNGEWYLQSEGVKTLNLRFPAEARKNSKDVWTFGETSYIGKLGKAAGVGDELFTAEMNIGALMEGVVMFQLGAEKNAKGYVNVRCKQPSAKHAAIPVPEWNANPCFISFDGDNDETSLKELNASVRNTMAMASDFGSSGVRQELEALGHDFTKFKGHWKSEEEQEASTSKKKSEKKAQEPPKAPVEDDFDKDEPF